MYEVFKAAIMAGNWKLDDVFDRLQRCCAQGRLTVDEMTELEDLARSKVDTRDEVDVFAKLDELDRRVRALETGAAAPDTGSVDDFIDGKWYHTGDKVLFDGKTYTCIAPDGVVCVWSPEAYPTYWEVT